MHSCFVVGADPEPYPMLVVDEEGKTQQTQFEQQNYGIRFVCATLPLLSLLLPSLQTLPRPFDCGALRIPSSIQAASGQCPQCPQRPCPLIVWEVRCHLCSVSSGREGS